MSKLAVFVLGILLSNYAFAGKKSKGKRNDFIQSLGEEISCDEKHTVKDELGNEVIYAICADSSISFDQTQARNCGPTAAANILRTYCNSEVTGEVFHKYFMETISAWGYKYTYSIGTIPRDLKNGLNRAWSHYCSDELYRKYHWRLINSGNPKDYLRYLYRSVNWNHNSPFKRKVSEKGHKNVWPLIALIMNGPNIGNLHYITVVDIKSDTNINQLLDREGSVEQLLKDTKCEVIFNTWEDQYSLDCLNFAKAASFSKTDIVQENLLDDLKYTIIDLVPVQ